MQEKYDKKTIFFRTSYLIVVFLRVLLIIPVLINPAYAFLLLLYDNIDFTLSVFGKVTYREYTLIDKTVDALNRTYFLLAAYIFHWEYFWLLLLLYLFRLVGDFITYKKANLTLWVIFADYFQTYFFILLFLKTFSIYPDPLTLLLLLITGAFFILTLELVLHYYLWIGPFEYIFKKAGYKKNKEGLYTKL